MRVWLFSNIKDEENVAEWCLHHARFGFETIYIFDHQSETPISKDLEPIQERIAKYGTKIEIQVIDWKLPIKTRAMNEALSLCKKNNVDWLIYIDGDEYLSLHPRHNDSILNLISSAQTKFENGPDAEIVRQIPAAISQQTLPRAFQSLAKGRMASASTTLTPRTTKRQVGAIGINWLMFGSSHLEKQPESKTLLDQFVKCSGTLDMHVKTIACVKFCVSATNPHYYNLLPTAVTITAGGELANHAAPADLSPELKNLVSQFRSRTFGPFIFNYRFPVDDERVDAFLAHYVVQSYDRHYHRKVIRATDDCGVLRTAGKAPDKEEFHKQFNEMTYLGMKERYAVQP